MSESGGPVLIGPVDTGDGYHRYTLPPDKHFDVPQRYLLQGPKGAGSYGYVMAAHDTVTGEQVAIKKCVSIFSDLRDTRRILRELRLLSWVRHENVLSVVDVISPRSLAFDDIYLVTELSDTDAHNVIRSQQPLADEHHQYFVYQLLRGLKYIHSASIIHRDIKPANLLVDLSCDLRICDFGLARAVRPEPEADNNLTIYVVTRWYRAPELLVDAPTYTDKVDVWSVACVFAELLNRRPLFPGRHHAHMLDLLVEVLGSPTEEELAAIQAPPAAAEIIRGFGFRPRASMATVVPGLTHPDGLALLDSILQWDPAKRPSAAELLAHPYVRPLHDPTDEPVAPEAFAFSDDDEVPLDGDALRIALLAEAARFHPQEVMRLVDGRPALRARVFNRELMPPGAGAPRPSPVAAAAGAGGDGAPPHACAAAGTPAGSPCGSGEAVAVAGEGAPQPCGAVEPQASQSPCKTTSSPHRGTTCGGSGYEGHGVEVSPDAVGGGNPSNPATSTQSVSPGTRRRQLDALRRSARQTMAEAAGASTAGAVSAATGGSPDRAVGPFGPSAPSERPAVEESVPTPYGSTGRAPSLQVEAAGGTARRRRSSGGAQDDVTFTAQRPPVPSGGRGRGVSVSGASPQMRVDDVPAAEGGGESGAPSRTGSSCSGGQRRGVRRGSAGRGGHVRARSERSPSSEVSDPQASVYPQEPRRKRSRGQASPSAL